MKHPVHLFKHPNVISHFTRAGLDQFTAVIEQVLHIFRSAGREIVNEAQPSALTF